MQHWSDALNGGKVQLQKRIWNMQGKFLENLNVRVWRIITTYGLDCAHHFIASNLAGDAFQRIAKDSNVQLISNHRHLELVENMMRGGAASVFHSGFFKANKKERPTSTQIKLAPTGS